MLICVLWCPFYANLCSLVIRPVIKLKLVVHLLTSLLVFITELEWNTCISKGVLLTRKKLVWIFGQGAWIKYLLPWNDGVQMWAIRLNESMMKCIITYTHVIKNQMSFDIICTLFVVQCLLSKILLTSDWVQKVMTISIKKYIKELTLSGTECIGVLDRKVMEYADLAKIESWFIANTCGCKLYIILAWSCEEAT